MHNDQQPTKAALMFVLAAVIVVHVSKKWVLVDMA